MSNFTQGNQAPDSGSDNKPEQTGTSRPLFGKNPADAPGAEAKPFQFSRPPGTPGPAETPERKPLFPPRDPLPGSPARALSRPGETRPGETRPLFPPREAQEERKPLFAQRDNQPQPTEYKSLFSNKEQAAGTTPYKSLFAPKTDEQSAAKPGLGAQPAPRPSLFGKQPQAPAKPVFSGGHLENSKPAMSSGFTTSAPSLPGTASRDIKVTDAEFKQLRDFLYDQSGIFIAENRKYLVENRLAARLRELGLRSFGEYYNFLRFDSSRSEELNKLFEYMTTNETSFFRNQPQLDVFRDQVLKKVLDEQRAKGQKKLRIWSAGCSSGEEPYTLAIILSEVLRGELASWDIKITANDLSLAMLAAARRGMYNDYSVRTTPPDLLSKYFTKEGSLYRIDPKLARLISFGQINLSDKVQLAKVERSQIVFCRNVIIYFDDEMKRSVISAFYDNLLPGGYLIIGHSESLHNISRAFKPEHHAGSIVYLKQS